MDTDRRDFITPDGDMADISVIVPVYNRAHQLPAMLESLRRQTLRPREVIFVDNNSSDGSPDIIRHWAEQRRKEGWEVILINEPRPGASLARHTGELAATSTYLSFFDSDDAMHPDFIRKAADAFAADPSLDITVWNVTFIRPDGSRRNRRILPRRILENHLVQGLLSTQSYAVRRTVLAAAGGWSESIGGWDDWELGLRLILSGARISVTDESRADITVQQDSITGLGYLHRKGDWENTLAAMRRDAERASDPKTRDYILRMLAYRRAILAAHYGREGDSDAAVTLLRDALSEPVLSLGHRLAIRAAYIHTRAGVPAAGAIFPPLLR